MCTAIGGADRAFLVGRTAEVRPTAHPDIASVKTLPPRPVDEVAAKPTRADLCQTHAVDRRMAFTDLELTTMAIKLARENAAAGALPFGAVVARDGAVLATGVNTTAVDHDPSAHAEAGAVRAACRQLNALAERRHARCQLRAVRDLPVDRAHRRCRRIIYAATRDECRTSVRRFRRSSPRSAHRPMRSPPATSNTCRRPVPRPVRNVPRPTASGEATPTRRRSRRLRRSGRVLPRRARACRSSSPNGTAKRRSWRFAPAAPRSNSSTLRSVS